MAKVSFVRVVCKFLLYLMILLVLGCVGYVLYQSIANDEQATTPEVGQLIDNQPVIYPIDQWQSSDANVADLTSLQQQLGKEINREEVLDYQGDFAQRIDYQAVNQAPLYVVDSPKFFELVWYYPMPSDDQNRKNLAIAHAQKVYGLMGGLAGKTGETLVVSMLNKQVVNAKMLGGFAVVQADCQPYRCRIILVK